MTNVITIANQKGGVGKSTSAAMISLGLANKGRKVLAVDCDSQANLTSYFGAKKASHNLISLSGLIDIANDVNQDMEHVKKEDIIWKFEGVDLITSNIRLAAKEQELKEAFERERVLKRIIDNFKDDYDYVILDTGPSLGLLLTNALAASDEVLIPTEPEEFAAEGINDLLLTINMIHKRINPKLSVKGIIITKVDSRSNEHKSYIQALRNTYGKKINVFDSVVPISEKAREAPRKGVNLYQYSKRSFATKAYTNIVKEIMDNELQ